MLVVSQLTEMEIIGMTLSRRRLQEGAAQGARGRGGGRHQAVPAGGAARAQAAGARHATAGGLAARARLQ